MNYDQWLIVVVVERFTAYFSCEDKVHIAFV